MSCVSRRVLLGLLVALLVSASSPAAIAAASSTTGPGSELASKAAAKAAKDQAKASAKAAKDQVKASGAFTKCVANGTCAPALHLSWQPSSDPYSCWLSIELSGFPPNFLTSDIEVYYRHPQFPGESEFFVGGFDPVTIGPDGTATITSTGGISGEEGQDSYRIEVNGISSAWSLFGCN